MTRRTLLAAAAAATLPPPAVATPAVARPDGDRLVLLGTKGGPAVRGYVPSPSSSLLVLGGQSFVIDAGYGTTFKLVDAGFALPSLRHLFLTHMHSDHVLEAVLLPYNAWAIGLRETVHVWGPPGTHDMIARGLDALRIDIDTRIADEGRPDLRQLVVAHEIDEGAVVQAGAVSVTALRVPHPPLADCFAFRFQHGPRAAVLSGDTAFFPPLADFAHGADLLAHEVAFGPGLEALAARNPNAARLVQHLRESHTLAEDVGRIAAMAGVRRLVLNHFVPADDPSITAAMWRDAVAQAYAGEIVVGRDGLAVPLA